MGGRGSSSTKAGSGKTTLEEYLAERGLASPLSGYMDDKMRIPHGLTRRQELKMQKEAHNVSAAYHAKREASIAEYKAGVASGKIKEKSTIDRLIDRAHGHPDLEATHAARRALEKRGYNWKTGKKSK